MPYLNRFGPIDCVNSLLLYSPPGTTTLTLLFLNSSASLLGRSADLWKGLAKGSLGTTCGGGRPREAASFSRAVGTGLAGIMLRGKYRDFCPGWETFCFEVGRSSKRQLLPS